MTNQSHPLPCATLKTLPELARQWSKAVERGKGMRLSADDLELLTSVGVNDLVQQAAATFLKENISCRERRSQNPYIVAENIGSTGTERQMDPCEVLTLPFFGIAESEDASDLLARAQATQRKPWRP